MSKTITITVEVDDKTSNTKVEEVISVIGYSAKDSIVIKQQGNLELHGEPHIKIVKKGHGPMVLLDGKESSVEVLNDLDLTKVKNIFVIKGHEALQVSSDDKVKHDVIVVNSKEGSKEKFSIVINDSLATKNNNTVRIKLTSLGNEDAALIIIDGKECTLQELNKLDQTEIKSINVTKTGDEVTRLGEKAKHGIVKVVMLREDENADGLIRYDNLKYGTLSKRKVKHKFQFNKGDKMPMFYIGDKEVSQEDVANLDPNTIDSFSILKDESATRL